MFGPSKDKRVYHPILVYPAIITPDDNNNIIIGVNNIASIPHIIPEPTFAQGMFMIIQI